MYIIHKNAAFKTLAARNLQGFFIYINQLLQIGA